MWCKVILGAVGYFAVVYLAAQLAGLNELEDDE